MSRRENRKHDASRPVSLTDSEITTARVGRRSFLSRTVLAGSIAVGAALTAACPGATDSDGAGDSDSQPTDSDQSQ